MVKLCLLPYPCNVRLDWLKCVVRGKSYRESFVCWIAKRHTMKMLKQQRVLWHLKDKHSYCSRSFHLIRLGCPIFNGKKKLINVKGICNKSVCVFPILRKVSDQHTQNLPKSKWGKVTILGYPIFPLSDTMHRAGFLLSTSHIKVCQIKGNQYLLSIPVMKVPDNSRGACHSRGHRHSRTTYISMVCAATQLHCLFDAAFL